MTKIDIAGKMQERLGWTSKQSLDIVNTIFEMMKETLAAGYDLKISGFGNFIVSDKAPRRGRNPQTGEKITITAHRTLTFKAGKALKDGINGRA